MSLEIGEANTKKGGAEASAFLGLVTRIDSIGTTHREEIKISESKTSKSPMFSKIQLRNVF